MAEADERSLYLISSIRRGDVDLFRTSLTDLDPSMESVWGKALTVAVEEAQIDMASMILSRGGSVNYKSEGGKTCLHYAAQLEDGEAMVELLMQGGAEVNAQDAMGMTPLHYAILSKQERNVDALIRFGGHVDTPYLQDTGEHIIHFTVRYDVTGRILKRVLATGCDVNVVTTPKQRTALHICAKLNNLTCLELLCCVGASVNLRDHKGCTALHRAAQMGALECVSCLLSNSANASITDEEFKTALHHVATVRVHAASSALNRPCDAALAWRLTNTAGLLLQNGCPVDAASTAEGTALHSAAQSGNIPLTELLISQGADVNAAEGLSGHTPLLTAISRGRFDLARRLVTLGADVNQPDKGMMTPLHRVPAAHATAADKLSLVDTLLRYRAKVNAQTQRGQTPLELSVHQSVLAGTGRLALFRLVQAGAALCCNHKSNRSMRSSLCWLTWHGEHELARFLVDAGWSLRYESWIKLPAKDKESHAFQCWLGWKTKQPDGLKKLSRRYIRLYLSFVGNDCDVLPSIQKLPLPEIIKCYLALDDIAVS